MNRYLSTQKEILDIIESFNEKGKGWAKFHGDVVCRIFKEYISKDISYNYKVVGPNVYIKGFPQEFDLLIVKSEAKPKKYTNAFEPDDVKYVLEIKASGVMGGLDIIRKTVLKIKHGFDKVKEVYPHIKFLYLTQREVVYPKRKDSINYLRETKMALAPYEVFCLKDSRSNKIIEGEWERLVTFLNKKL